MNQDHEQYRDAVHALRDGELAGARRAELLAHMELCSECRALLRRWEAVGRALRAGPIPTAAETERFTHRVMESVGAEPASPAWLSWLEARWLLPATGLATAALLLALSMTGPEMIAPPDALILMGDAPSRADQLLLAPDPSRPSGLLDLIAENP